MATTIQCSHCGQTYDLTDEQVPQYAGQTITCTRCQRPFTVPASIAGGAEAPVAGPPPVGTAAGGGPAYGQPVASSGQYGMQPAAAAGPKQTNGFAIASLICGILGCTGIGGILAIVFGILGIQKATRDPNVGGKGIAIAGIVLGAMMFLMACPISILLPSLNRAREAANRVKCASNLRQMGQAMQIYASQNKGHLPSDLTALVPAGVPLVVFTCPSSNDTAASNAPALKTPGHLSYVYVYEGRHVRLRDIRNPARAVLVYEPMTNHDNDGTNILFVDGHVEFVKPAQAQPMIDQANAGAQERSPQPTGAGGL